MKIRSVLVLVVPALLSACAGMLDPVVCTTEARSTFAVTVLDGETGENLAPGAVVWVREGEFVDTLHAAPWSAVYSGAVYERPGMYEVVVEHPAYVDWQRSDVHVDEDECHVITRELTAELTPRP